MIVGVGSKNDMTEIAHNTVDVGTSIQIYVCSVYDNEGAYTLHTHTPLQHNKYYMYGYVQYLPSPM